VGLRMCLYCLHKHSLGTLPHPRLHHSLTTSTFLFDKMSLAVLNTSQDSLKAEPDDVTFLQQLKESEDAVVFKVLFRGIICVMKMVCPGSV